MKRYTGFLIVIGSIGIMVGLWFSAYQFGQQVAYDECLPTMRAMNAKLIEYAVADSLRQCFEARPEKNLVTIENCDSVANVINEYRRKMWDKYIGEKDTLLDSLIDTSFVFYGDFTEERRKEILDSLLEGRKGYLNVTLKFRPKPTLSDSLKHRQCEQKRLMAIGHGQIPPPKCTASVHRSYLYTDSGLNWSALPFLFTGDSSVIMLTTVNRYDTIPSTGNKWPVYLRVLEWVQRPTVDTVCARKPRLGYPGNYVYYTELRYRWSARVEGM